LASFSATKKKKFYNIDTWNPHLRDDFLTHFANVAEEFKNFALFQR
jgi:hypothetical protein